MSALKILPKKGMQRTYDSLQHILSMHRLSLSRGKAKTIFADPSTKVMYKCLGVRVSRASTGVLNYDAWAERVGAGHWERVLRMVRRAELLFETFAGDEVIQHIKAAKYASPFKTMNAPPDATSRRIPPAKYFGGIAFGCNVFLCCHTDDDFTLSTAHILLDGSDVYSLDDEVVVYFCFPTLGVAVPMRPGDFLLFNSRIPHCISSRCRYADKIMCISMFLKTAVVGLNNNSLPLTPVQLALASKYREIVGLKRV